MPNPAATGSGGKTLCPQPSPRRTHSKRQPGRSPNRLEPISPNLEHGRRRYRRCFPPMSNATGRPGEPCFQACHGNGQGSVRRPVVARRPRCIRSSQWACGAPSLQPTFWSFAGISAKGRWDPGRADYQRLGKSHAAAPWPPIEFHSSVRLLEEPGFAIYVLAERHSNEILSTRSRSWAGRRSLLANPGCHRRSTTSALQSFWRCCLPPRYGDRR